jgi:hypothetical protein
LVAALSRCASSFIHVKGPIRICLESPGSVRMARMRRT